VNLCICVCVIQRKRERERKSVCSVCLSDRERERVCALCVCLIERECVCDGDRKRERECKNEVEEKMKKNGCDNCIFHLCDQCLTSNFAFLIESKNEALT